MGTYHEGELLVQKRAGVEDAACKVGAMFHDFVPEAARVFLANQRFLVIGSEDEKGLLWASPLTGPAGFVQAVEPQRILIEAKLAEDDPLTGALSSFQSAEAGLLAIEFETRRRMRVNGSVRPIAQGLELNVEQAYSNCPKYIQSRAIEAEAALAPSSARGSSSLSDSQLRTVGNADTLFVASIHPERGADASHRGGAPGFVRAVDERTLVLPDYRGNNMFNTLGNVAVDPRLGLLFVDFPTGDALQLSGTAEIVWNSPWLADLAGAQRAVVVHVDAVVERRAGIPLRWGNAAPSPFNP